MAADLFTAGSAKVWSIPAGLDFLGTLAQALADATQLAQNPGALNDAIIYVPNRRSARALAQKLFEASGGRVLLAPDIRPLGDLETEDEAPIAEIALNGLPVALTPAERLGALARMVQVYYRTRLEREIPPLAALKAARDLARLLDQAALAGAVNWDALPDLVERADLATHWQASVQFLDIIRREWPDYLTRVQRMDAATRRFAAAGFLCEHWARHPPEDPVIVAGSTGATPAGQLIMRAVLNLPKGLIVLPGFDSEALAQSETIEAAPSHPQHILFRTLKALEVEASHVQSFPASRHAQDNPSRRRIIHAALAPASDTADWQITLANLAGRDPLSAFAQTAFQGLSVCEFAHEAAEADAAALLMRQTLETPGKTAALVTPDAGLARRVSSLLKRWNIFVEPSSGTPLNRAPAGRFALACARWMLDPSDPLLLTTALKHETARVPGDVDACERFFLRGPRAWTNFAQLDAHITGQVPRDDRDAFTPDDQAAASLLINAVSATLKAANADVSAIESLSGADFLDRLSALMIRIADGTTPFAGEDGRALVKLFEHFSQLTASLGNLAPVTLCELLEAETSRAADYSNAPSHPRLAIWGPLEARLQTADRLVLAGLNEKVWPDRTAADAFLPRRFRDPLGLRDIDEQTGLAAHDFAQLAAAPEVYLLYARRRDDGPAVASRWVWRLRTLARGALGNDADNTLAPDLPLESWIAARERDGRDTLPDDFSAKPSPRQRPLHWPSALSATRVELLVRDPYALWAEQVLRLSADAPLNESFDVRQRGTAIHRAIELFEGQASGHSTDALAHLLETCLLAAGEPREAIVARKAVMRRTAEWYLTWRAERIAEGCASPMLEKRGTLTLSIAGAPFRLSATADRIDILPDARIRITDFKTGTPPSDKEIKSGFSWQMPLQALIALEGGFSGVKKAPVEGLDYLAFKAKPDLRRVGEKDATPPEAFADQARTGLIDLISAARNGSYSILSAPRAQFRKYEGDYGRLARRAEWGGENDEEGDAGDA